MPGAALLLSEIGTKEELAQALGVSFQKHIVYYLYRLPPTARYRPFEIKKRSGGLRTIHAPQHGLKVVQKRLAKLLAQNYHRRSGVHGFVAERSIVTNARAHVRQRYILNIDLQEFFSSINFGRVRGILQSSLYGANEEVATVIAQLCCFNDTLPQGAPTSPVISNMICGKLDAQFKKLAREVGCTYTRYCDDITLSSDRSKFPAAIATVSGFEKERRIWLGESVLSIVKDNGFAINEKKSRLLTRSDRQEVTGLVVNSFVNVPRKYIRNVRGALHNWRKYGMEATAENFRTKYETRSRDKADFESVMFGKIQYIGMIRGFDDQIYTRFRTWYNSLSSLKIPLHATSREFTLENGIWVFEADGGLDEIDQGTAFFLEGVGLVTCAHCVGPNGNHIYQPGKPSAKFAVKVEKKSDDIDLAILRFEDGVTAPAHANFKVSSTMVQRGDRVTLAGFPKFGPGSQLSVKDGQVQSIKYRSSIRRFNISTPVIHGNSGGPVFDQRGQVIGVAVTGAATITTADTEEAHSAIPISALEHL